MCVLTENNIGFIDGIDSQTVSLMVGYAQVTPLVLILDP